MVKEQCRAVAKTGRTNMFDVRAAFDIAAEMGFMELCDFMFMNTPAYSTLLLTGELSDKDIIEF